MKTPIDRRQFSIGATAAAALAAITGKPVGAAAGDVSDDRISALVKELKTGQACQEVTNLMARFMAARNYRQPEDILACFALDQPDVSWEFADEGVFKGPAAVTQIIKETYGPPKAGEMTRQNLSTPAIEVAADLKTAKGFWRAPGFGVIPTAETLPVPIWAWDQIAADFITDGSLWKIWHGHAFTLIKCNYHESWADDVTLINRPNVPLHPLSTFRTYHNPYSPLSMRESIPAVPIPYETWTDSNWMLERDKSK